MKKILIIDTTWPINSRTERFRTSLLKKYFVNVSAWNRGNAGSADQAGTYVLNGNINYGNRLKKLMSLPKFILHNISVSKKVSPEIIFASHWDSLICAVFVRVFSKHKIKIIYDCLDLPTSSNPAVLKILKTIERVCLYFTDFVIFASRHYPILYSLKQESIVFENYPSKFLPIEEYPVWKSIVDNIKKDGSVTISWIGVVRYPEILCNLIEAIKSLDVKLLIFGNGPSLEYLESHVVTENISHKVFFFGKYEQHEIPYIYTVTDFVWAAYPTNDFNSIYAISNKYFESSLFSRRPIFSKKTKMAESLIDIKNSVLLVDEYDVKSIVSELSTAIDGGFVNLPFEKYEEDIYWNDKEMELLDALFTL